MSVRPDVSHLDRHAYLFGYPIKHSLSPLHHQTTYDALRLNWSQLLFESTDMADFLNAIKDPKFFGASVTMPHKVTIIPHLDELTPECQAIGACNTIFLKEVDGKRKFCGTNTDCIGIRDGIGHNVSKEKLESFKGKPGLIIGGGGTSRAAVYTMKKWFGCSSIYMINRDKSEVDAVVSECTAAGLADSSYLTYVADEEQAKVLEAPAVVVSAVPNFPPKSEEEIRARGCVEIMLGKGKGVLLEMCYHPSPDTEIAMIAGKEGWQVVPGVQAMIYQGFEQERLWTGRELNDLPVEKVKAVVETAASKNH